MNITFYILENAPQMRALLFACECVEKAYTQQQSVYIHTTTRADAERLDALLWTYRDDSFIPHSLHHPGDDLPPPILIGYEQPPQAARQVLINLSHEVPSFYTAFSEVIEIVSADPHMQQLARERFKKYREQECEINTHKIKLTS